MAHPPTMITTGRKARISRAVTVGARSFMTQETR
jgi:hypothetical protein